MLCCPLPPQLPFTALPQLDVHVLYSETLWQEAIFISQGIVP